MGQYKVPQDVEAEDQILGPLTIKQFLYTVIGVVYGLITFALFRAVPIIFILVGLPPTLLLLLLGLYRRQDQPFEAYFLALLNYFGRSRLRIWEKEPIEEVFKIEPPKIQPEQAQRDPREVMGQLEKLAHIVDTRGYVTKQEAVQMPSETPTLELDTRERLVTPDSYELPAVAGVGDDINVEDDILDFQNNPNAQNLGALIEDSSRKAHDEAVAKMNDAPSAAPASASPSTSSGSTPSVGGMTPDTQAGILKLAMESDDLKVSHVAAQAAKQGPMTEGQSVNLKSQAS